MRSKFLVCAAIAAVGWCQWFASVAHAADAKARAAEAKSAKSTKPTELHADDKSIKKQSQWEDKVMGPDSKRVELEKIARARAINDKAEKDKEKQAAIEAAAPAPRATPVQARKADKTEVSLLSPEHVDASKPHDISPKLETAAAQAPVRPLKPADDKFIDKLLRQEDAPSQKRASATDKELENLLKGAKENKPAGRKHGDSVDDLLRTADKGPAMPAPRAQSGGLPEWAKQPDISPTPVAPPPPVAVKPPSKNDGVIHVIQGAAGGAAAVVVPERPTPVAARPGRKTASKTQTPVVWNDPFAEKKPMAAAQPKKEPASRPSASSEGNWSDPFAEPDDSRKTVRRTTPAAPSPSAPTSAPKRDREKSEPSAHPAGWKDPFTKAPEPTRTPVAMREPGKNESSKWEVAARHSAHATASDTHAAGGWGVLKKRAR
jgi:hypothetical protein